MSRDNYYARVMLTSYPARHWDVGDMYAGEEAAREKDMEQAILAGRAVVGILKHFRQKKQGGEPEKEAASLLNEETEDTPKKKGGPVFKYVAYGVGGVAAVAAGYFLWKASRS